MLYFRETSNSKRSSRLRVQSSCFGASASTALLCWLQFCTVFQRSLFVGARSLSKETGSIVRKESTTRKSSSTSTSASKSKEKDEQKTNHHHGGNSQGSLSMSISTTKSSHINSRATSSSSSVSVSGTSGTTSSAALPEQVHLAYGHDVLRSRYVQWSVMDEDVETPAYVVFSSSKTAVENFDDNLPLQQKSQKHRDLHDEEEDVLRQVHEQEDKLVELEDSRSEPEVAQDEQKKKYLNRSGKNNKLRRVVDREPELHLQQKETSTSASSKSNLDLQESNSRNKNPTTSRSTNSSSTSSTSKSDIRTAKAESFLFHVPKAGAWADVCKEEWNFTAACVARTHAMHVANMTEMEVLLGDEEGTTGQEHKKYYYKVGRAGAWSKVFDFSLRRADDLAEQSRGIQERPLSFVIYGDMGDYNAPSRPEIQRRVSELDAVIHVGDFAYDLDSDDGKNGDAFMRDMEPIVAHVPYMTLAGNHEISHNFSHYVNRFQNMPSNDANAAIVSFPQLGGPRRQNLWHSFVVGPVKFLLFSTEFHLPKFAERFRDLRHQQWSFLEREIASTNRTKTPWLIACSHHPVYCSTNNSDCHEETQPLRVGVEPDGEPQKSVAELLDRGGVDLYFNGHVHNYERMFDVAPKEHPTDAWRGGESTQRTVDPPATTFIVAGAAGGIEMGQPFDEDMRHPRTAFRKDAFSWGMLKIYNRSHVKWQQFANLAPSTDNITLSSTGGGGQDEETMGVKPLDEFWLVQNHHVAPFAQHPNRGKGLVLEQVAGKKTLTTTLVVEAERRGTSTTALVEREDRRRKSEGRGIASSTAGDQNHGTRSTRKALVLLSESATLTALGGWQATKRLAAGEQLSGFLDDE
ncbi:unnamed protein product [Amoebophrya sp. A25]|nr:unnamed protein product [Amoebophrya sp. A25]|eukprot:GSA25T00024793001.1